MRVMALGETLTAPAFGSFCLQDSVASAGREELQKGVRILLWFSLPISWFLKSTSSGGWAGEHQ